MTIYRSVVCDILNELAPSERIRIKKENDFDDEMYLCYMIGRMKPILEHIVESDCEIAD